jgi:selenocysteine lyase/cysteine desulfurase
MRYLRDYWARPLLEEEGIRLHTSLKPEFSCGLANVELVGMDPARLNNWLWKEHRIITVAIKHPEFQGIRVTPSVYTTLEELDRFVEAMLHARRYGIA